ncbi:hypothetical protein [Aureispira sp. CCB-QB1]|uniref:hypothetical protein n=1 Tax=Aureispira sp. CCB-QB1 TaxID=1313421 RepID=UPI000696B864|nr:hypothetical protein [Aureispira sp. CCB-QB1]
MKTLYRIQAFLGFILYLIGFNLEQEQQRLVAIFYENGYDAGPYGKPSMYFAIAAGIYCLYCFLVAIRTAQRLPFMGRIWSVASLCLGIFSVILFSSPRAISLEECFWAWTLYIALGWGWTVIVYRTIDNAPIMKPIYKDEILDDLSTSSNE